VSEAETVRCPKCQGGIWNDTYSEALKTGYRFSCVRCGFTVKVAGCRDCKAAMELVHGVDPRGGHRPFFRFRCGHCGREVRFQSDVYAGESAPPSRGSEKP